MHSCNIWYVPRENTWVEVTVEVSVVVVNCPGLQSQLSSNTAPVWTVYHHHHSTVKVGLSVKN